MNPPEVERKLAAILSADAVGYSRLMAEDEAATIRALTTHREVTGTLIRQHRGRVVDSPGDNLLAEFPSAFGAVQAAVEIQRVVSARNADLPPDRKMEFRIGVHLGDVTLEGLQIYGDGVNIAARLEALADPGGICISGMVYEQVRSKLRLSYEDLGDQPIKNLPNPVRVYRIRMSPEDTAGEEPEPGADELTVRGLSGGLTVLVVPAVWILYLAIVFEILFMISPFAFYYYSAYGPSLNVFHGSPWTAWLTEFFLPHFSRTSSPVLNAREWVGGISALLGMALFLAGFVQIYTAKVQRRGLVTGGLYAVSRHPQYLALALLGFGTLLWWPRFLILITYVTMLFLYWSLARRDEERCLKRFGESYRAYRERTGMFLPGRLFGKLPGLLPPSGRRRVFAVLALYLVTLVATVSLAYGLRDYSLSRISSLYTEDVAVLSPAVLSDEEISSAFRVAVEGAEVRQRLETGGRNSKLLVYVVPLAWELADLPIALPENPHGGHYVPADFDRTLYKVLFTKPRTYDQAAQGERIVKTAYGRDPIILVSVNTETTQITDIETPPPHVIWGDIPTPLF